MSFVPSSSVRRLFRAAGAGVLCLASAALAGAQVGHRGRKYTPPPETAKISVTVMRESNGKPIRNAAVIFHPLKNGKDQGAMEVKTDEDGKTAIDVIPVGDTVRLQIVADGFQTFGNDYVIDSAAKDIAVRMKRPQAQYSIYKGNATGDQSGQATTRDNGQSKPEEQPPQDTSKPQR